MASTGGTELIDYFILGAGPAGLQLGYYLQQSGRDYLILDENAFPGAFFARYPRHRRLISINKRFTGMDDPDTNLRWDWNSLLTDDNKLSFTSFSDCYFPEADGFVQYLAEFAKQYELNIKFNERATQIEKGDGFTLRCESGSVYEAKRLIVATGLYKPRVIDVDGIEHCESYADVSVDPKEFQNQRVLVIGKGNSGLETADNLINSAAVVHLLSRNPLRLAWKTHYVGDLRAVNNDFLDTYQLKSQNTILDADVERIERQDDGKLLVSIHYTHANDQRIQISVDRVITCTGFEFDDEVFCPETMPIERTPCEKFPAMTSSWESQSVQDLYFAGVLMHGRDYRKSFSGFVHGFRYNIRALHQILEERFEGVSLPSSSLPFDVGSLARCVIDRVNQSSSLFQQPGFLADVFLLEGSGDQIQHYRDLPVDYVQQHKDFRNTLRMFLTMEYGHISEEMDPFNIVRYPTDGTKSTFIHPVIRWFEGEQLQHEYHVPEDLENMWDKEMYTLPLRQQLDTLLSTHAV